MRFLAPFFSPQSAIRSPQSTVFICCIFYTERLRRKGRREGYERLADSVLKMAARVTCGFRDYMVALDNYNVTTDIACPEYKYVFL